MPIGTGMSALAQILKDLGNNITGSDTIDKYFTEDKLLLKNIRWSEFKKDNIIKNKIYIISSVYNIKNNIEVKEIINKNYEWYYYHEFINHFFKGIKVGVSGTHGKTTSVSIISKMFEKEKIACLIGDGTGFSDIDYKYFIFEACEYKNHFLAYNYDYLIINNIDYDHSDFFNSIEEVIDSFQKAANNSKAIIYNNDCNNSCIIKHNNIFSFGINIKSDMQAKIIKEDSKGYLININVKDINKQYYLPFNGIHMIYNFLSSLSVYYLCGLDLDLVQYRLIDYKLPLRRLSEYKYKNNIIIDDYAHHPNEIKSCMEAIKQKYPKRDLIVIFQPHTYSRTINFKSSFKDLFVNVKKFYLRKTFSSSREKKSKKLEKETLKIFNYPKYYNFLTQRKLLKTKNNIILFVGAGNSSNLIKKIYENN